MKYVHELELAGICKELEGQEGLSQSLSKKEYNENVSFVCSSSPLPQCLEQLVTNECLLNKKSQVEDAQPKSNKHRIFPVPEPFGVRVVVGLWGGEQ